MLCYYLSKWSGQEGLDDDLHRLVTWSAEYGLLINNAKCVECLFYPQNTSQKLSLSLINGEALSRKQTVKYLGVHFTSNLIWSFFIRRLRSMKFKIPLMAIFFSLRYSLILYYSPIIFPGLRNKNFASIKKCIRLLSTSSGLAYTHIYKVLISQHFKYCKRFSTSPSHRSRE